MANTVNGISAWYDSERLNPIPLNETLDGFLINQGQIFEDVPSNSNSKDLYFENINDYILYGMWVQISRDETQLFLDSKKATITFGNGMPQYRVNTGDWQPNQMTKVTLNLNIPRSGKIYTNLEVDIVCHNMTNGSSIPSLA